MKLMFDVKDVIDFILNQFNYLWDGKIRDTKSFRYRNAVIEDFIPQTQYSDTKTTTHLKVVDIKEYNKYLDFDIAVTNTSFCVEQYFDIHNVPLYSFYDTDWQNFLFERYPEMYAPIYIDIYEKKCAEIERTSPKKGVFKKKPKITGKNLENYTKYKNLIETARSYLTDDYGV